MKIPKIKFGTRWLQISIIILLILLALLIIPTLIIGELIYGASRQTDYPDLDGYTPLQLKTEDIKLQAWYTQTSAKVALIIHGHGDNSQLMDERYSPIFKNMGYDRVLLDLRNHGRSEHHPPVSMGIEEQVDVIAVLNWMRQQSWEEIVLFGTSMGSIAAILAQNEVQIADQLILDSSFSNPIEVMNNNFEKNYVIQPWRYLIVEYLTKIRHEVKSFPDILSILDNLTIPALIAHGSADIEAPPAFLNEVDNLGNPNLKTVMVNDGEHSKLYLHQSYIDAITSHLEDQP